MSAKATKHSAVATEKVAQASNKVARASDKVADASEGVAKASHRSADATHRSARAAEQANASASGSQGRGSQAGSYYSRHPREFTHGSISGGRPRRDQRSHYGYTVPELLEYHPTAKAS